MVTGLPRQDEARPLLQRRDWRTYVASVFARATSHAALLRGLDE